MVAPTSAGPGRIFISYRRDDSAFPAGWLYDRLCAHLGKEQVFKDIDSIEPGDDFVQVLEDAVGSCQVLLAFIGDRWLDITDETGQRRLDNPDDFVRLEIEAALRRDVRVIPVLVGQAPMPKSEQLPDSLRALVRKQAIELSPIRFESDVGRLLRTIDKTLARIGDGPVSTPEDARSASLTVLPFTDLSFPYGVAVDGAGNVYVTSHRNNRVLKLPAGTTIPTKLPFTGLSGPTGVAVDTAGTVYVTAADNEQVLKLAAGSMTQDVLPFTDLSFPHSVAVDGAGNVYVTSNRNNGVLKLPAGTTIPTKLPFTGLSGPSGVAVDTNGTIYVTSNRNNRVLKLPAGVAAPTELPFTGLSRPRGVAVDDAGTVYITDTGNNRVLKLPAGVAAPTELPFTGLNGPRGVAVDDAGTVYITDSNNNRVLKLPTG